MSILRIIEGTPTPDGFRFVPPSEGGAGFTPGPWQVGPIAGIFEPDVRATDGSIVAKACFRGSTQTESANAALIAAAPELYAALQALVNDARPIPYRQGEGTQFFRTVSASLVDAARAALAKAEGRAQ